MRTKQVFTQTLIKKLKLIHPINYFIFSHNLPVGSLKKENLLGFCFLTSKPRFYN